MALVLVERTTLRHALLPQNPSLSPSSPPACPHCRSVQVQKWGWFGGRRRYRCGSCARTFTALTGTPLAHLKHRDKWAEMGWCLLKGLSIRRSAQFLGVHPSTAFRWRHLFLSALRAYGKPHLTGVPELTVTNLVKYRSRLLAWGEPFRGVSAKYYRNYLTWFSFLDEHGGLGLGKRSETKPETLLELLLSKIFAGLSVAQEVFWSTTDGQRRRLSPALPWKDGLPCAMG